MRKLLAILLTLAFTLSCGRGLKSDMFLNPIMDSGQNADAVFYDGMYYYTHETSHGIRIWRTEDITDLRNAEFSDIEIPESNGYANNIWHIDIRRIGGKWYIYYAADNGVSDNHQIFVLECTGDDPLHDRYVQKGPVITNPDWNWAIHPSAFEYRGELYMAWSGWPHRRIIQETQCIYIAKMANPWTLASERVMISSPDYEWERQWINPNGSRVAYPIFVNEAPQFISSLDGKTAIIFYSASGCWTPYSCLGMLTNSTGDLLDSSSWKKSPEPVFGQNPESEVWGPGSPSFIPSPDGSEWYMIYHARSVENSNTRYEDASSPSPRLQPITWDEHGLPVLGTPFPLDKPLPKPSGTPRRQS